MNLSGFIGVAIGVIFMYLMLSLMCTVINEIIATILKMRATFLSATIIKIIDDSDVRAAFYGNGLISDSQVASGSAAAGAATVAGTAKPRDKAHSSYFDSRNVAMAILASLSATVNDAPDQKSFPDMAAIKQLVGDMPAGSLRSVLMASIATSEDKLDKLRDNIAAWFDTAMDRLSGEYKRRSKIIAIVVGVLIAGAVNADTYRVGRALWNDPALRAQVETAAGDAIKQDAQAKCVQADPVDKLKCLSLNLKADDDALRPLPMGWTKADFPTGGLEDWALWVCLKALAFLWTGLALSLGAPFWFDILQKVMNLRGTGPNPAEKKS